jgi:cyclophilin family peptidyl-prolyl cis-trans isomerase
MKRLSALLWIAGAALAQTTPPAAPAKTGTQAGTAPAAAPAREPGLYATFNTSMGAIVAKLFEKEVPVTVNNFVALARGTKPWKDPNTKAMVAKPLYNNITFHRVIPGFMIQTGDPTATGSHECGITIKDEILPTLKFDQPGRVAMANIGQPNTGGCQFFITDGPQPMLDAGKGNGAYTIFGQVVDGQEFVGKIARVPRDSNDKPRTPVKLISVKIERVGPAPGAPAKKSTGAAPKSTAAPTKK